MCLSCTEIPVVLKESVLRSHKDLVGLNLHIVDSVAALGQMITDHIMKEEEEGGVDSSTLVFCLSFTQLH
jgi:hypothetical protein